MAKYLQMPWWLLHTSDQYDIITAMKSYFKRISADEVAVVPDGCGGKWRLCLSAER
jgi:hypothetical protein